MPQTETNNLPDSSPGARWLKCGKAFTAWPGVPYVNFHFTKSLNFGSNVS